jgi:hypothetical protein
MAAIVHQVLYEEIVFVTVSGTSMDNFCNRVIGNINLKITSGKDEKGESFS